MPNKSSCSDRQITLAVKAEDSTSASPPDKLVNTISLYHSNDAINSLSFDTFIKQKHQFKKHQGVAALQLMKDQHRASGIRDTINLLEDEQVSAVEGSVGNISDVVEPVIISLTFRTSAGRTYGPYGGEEGTPFFISIDNGCNVDVGFFGRAGLILDAIGLQLSKHTRAQGRHDRW
uniref:Jacalin-type lectin domain-containing protein n=1 Tax=Leersia perrieri TaxID=77586 RepID=A0A0D9W1X2_9ORYZ